MPNDAALQPDLTGRNKAVETASRAEIDHVLAGLQDVKRERITDPGKCLDGAIGQGGHDHLIVAEPLRQRASGVEMVATVRIDRNGTVFRFNLLAQRERVYKQPVTHSLLLFERPRHSDKGVAQRCDSTTGRPAGQSPPHHWPLSASRFLGRATVREPLFPRAADDAN